MRSDTTVEKNPAKISQRMFLSSASKETIHLTSIAHSQYLGGD